MKRGLLFVTLLCAFLPPKAVGQEPDVGTVASTQERIVQRTVVPSPEKPQGEVQILRRGDQLVVRTLLASHVLKRVVAAIDEKERRNWPDTRDGHAASVRYRDELFQAMEKSWEMFRLRSDRDEIRQFLAIEFILADGRGTIRLALPVLKGEYGELDVVGQQVVKTWRAPNDYVRGNMVEIVKDSYHLEQQQAEELFDSLTTP